MKTIMTIFLFFILVGSYGQSDSITTFDWTQDHQEIEINVTVNQIILVDRNPFIIWDLPLRVNDMIYMNDIFYPGFYCNYGQFVVPYTFTEYPYYNFFTRRFIRP